jgi:hypothetical protein
LELSEKVQRKKQCHVKLNEEKFKIAKDQPKIIKVNTSYSHNLTELSNMSTDIYGLQLAKNYSLGQWH